MRKLTQVAAATGVAAVGALSWALLEARWYTLRRYSVPILPAGSPQLRVLHLSDLHLVPTQEAKRRWLRRLVTADPHIVINTGDNMAHADAMSAVIDSLAPLLARPGAFVMGSNDYYAPVLKNPARYLSDKSLSPAAPDEAKLLPGAELAEAFRKAGWQDLTNRRAVLDVEGVKIALVGTDDAHIGRDRFPEPEAGATSDADVRLGVTHAPYRRVLQAMKADGADLILAGHTHGGQLCVPGWGALVTNCDLDTGRAKGLHGWPGLRPDQPGGQESTWLHVSAGLGTSPYTPVRFACRPEATLLTLTARG